LSRSQHGPDQHLPQKRASVRPDSGSGWSVGQKIGDHLDGVAAGW